MADGEPQTLYSLYGVVEHSGTMRSGHYTAYVKVRTEAPKLASNGLEEQGKPIQPIKKKKERMSKFMQPFYSHLLLLDAEPPRGSWFHISDTSVQPVSESKVQSCQAYLLFYERMV